MGEIRLVILVEQYSCCKASWHLIQFVKKVKQTHSMRPVEMKRLVNCTTLNTF